MPDYLAHEGLEHAEKAREHLEGTSDPFLRFVPVVAAVLAVCAGLSSLWGNRLSEAMMLHGQEAVLAQTRASDTWNEYQANSLKAHINSAAGSVATDPLVRRKLDAAAIKYRKQRDPKRVEAQRLEAERTSALIFMDKTEAKKLNFDVATALFQISIVLASIAAMTRRSPLFVVGIVGGVIGLVYCALGFVR